MLEYKDICEVVRPGGLITFSEYTLDRHQRRKPTACVEKAPVEAVIPAGEALNREQIVAYYGEVDDHDALVLASAPYPRIVLQVADSRGQSTLKVIGLVEAYMGQNLQELEYETAAMPSVFSPDPANLIAEPHLKGFSDYQVGAGLIRNRPR